MKWTFMNTWDEWHSFVIGWCEGMLCWRKSHVKWPKHVARMIDGEFWYYTGGLVIGVVTFGGLLFAGVIYIISIL